MQSIQLKTEEKNSKEAQDSNIFSLRPLEQKGPITQSIVHDFTPILCSKSEKLISTLPSLSTDKSSLQLFDSDWLASSKSKVNPGSPLRDKSTALTLSRPTSGESKNVAEDECKAIFLAKPLSKVCQVCKEKFDDYLEHVGHDLHKKKAKAYYNDSHINFLNCVLQKKEAKRLKKVRMSQSASQCVSSEAPSSQVLEAVEKVFVDSRADSQASDREDGQENGMEPFGKAGSKKRIVESDDGMKSCVVVEQSQTEDSSNEDSDSDTSDQEVADLQKETIELKSIN